MIECVEIDKLSLSERNPRKITSTQFNKLVKSLREDPVFIEKRPILVNKVGEDLIVYAGHQRVRAASVLGWKMITCDIEINLSNTLMKSRMLKDNKTYGFFDDDILFCDYEEDELLDAGFLKIELDSGVGLEDDEGGKGKEAKKRTKECPECGHKY